MSQVIGLDVGGANTKAALLAFGAPPRVASEPFAVWRDPDGLPEVIARVVGGLGAGPVALTTTAELCDVFPSKADGVRFVLGAAARALPGRVISVLRTDGTLVGIDAARADPLPCAAANWVATALWVARGAGSGVLVDCGGTTTDIVPFAGGAVRARGRTDVERLRAGELVYTGAVRTSLAAVLGAGSRPVAAETFAVAADAHLLRGVLPLAAVDGFGFPDGRGASDPEVRARLARMVCADPGELGDGELEAIAAAAHEAQVGAIAGGLAQVLTAGRARAVGREVIAVGVGAFLARAAAARCGCAVRGLAAGDPLAGPGGDVAPAVALAALAARGWVDAVGGP